MLVRTSKRIAGFPPPGVVGEVDDERATAAIERGDAEDMSSLSARLRRKPEIATGGGDAGSLPAPEVEPRPAPSGDVLQGGVITKGDAHHLNDGS